MLRFTPHASKALRGLQRGARTLTTDPSKVGGMEEDLRPGKRSVIHFRLTDQPHPLGNMDKKPMWKNPMQNHVWEDEELAKLLKPDQPHHKPKGVFDWLTYRAVRFCYHMFNMVTGYSRHDPSPRAVAYRLLILESIAGVPGMVAGGMRHFRSLRRMQRDHGWIHTLLEEAENERMHLLVFMRMFKPGIVTRTTVVVAQYVLVALLTTVYAIRPQTVHRFVGYLEETAVTTYMDIIKWMETPGSRLDKEWGHLKAPTIAKGYWNLSDDATFLDVLKQICADEMHHRDVNHQFASMARDEVNPFIESHHEDQRKAWQKPTSA